MTALRLVLCIVALHLASGAAACGADGGDSGGSPSSSSGDVAGQSGADGAEGGDAGTSPDGSTASQEDAGPACAPQCAGKQCGDDGCGGTCGTCFGSLVCTEGECAPCVPSCKENGCGDDGCGVSCGECTESEICILGQCGPPPPANCLALAPCVMTACAGSPDVPTCITDALAECGPSESTTAETAAVALATCMDTEGCPFQEGGGRAECQRIYCLPETVSCSQETEGIEECHALKECVESDDCLKDYVTGEPTTTCVGDCLATGTAEAVGLYWSLMLCVDRQCLGSSYTDMDLCFAEETDTGGACRQQLRECLIWVM